MQIGLGEKIRSLRKRDGRRQDDLAAALGVTNQAVSRWEANKGYPDMEMIPAIANYFHVSIDELFGYDNDRETRLAAYIEEADRMREPDGGPCRATTREQEDYLRRALAEFPNEWRLQLRLAWVLETKALTGAQEDRINTLREVAELLEQAHLNTDDTGWRDSITRMIVETCREIGDRKKIEEIAAGSAPAYICREVLRTCFPDGEGNERFFGEAILALLHELTQVVNRNRTDDPGVFVSLAEFYQKLFGNGNYDLFNSDLCLLYLNAATVCARNNDKQGALSCFDTAYTHHLSFRQAWDKKENKPIAPLICHAVELPRRYLHLRDRDFRRCVADFPVEIANAIRSDPRYSQIFEA